MSAPGVLYAVGVGPGDPELITVKAARVLGRARTILAASSTKNDHSLALSIAEPYLAPGVRMRTILLGFPMTRDRAVLEKAWRDNAARTLEALADGRDAAFITLGDPLTYSTFLYLERAVRALEPGVRIEAVPGVSSIQAAAAAAGVGLAESGQNLVVLSGVDDPERLRQGLAAADNAVILKTYRSFPAIRNILVEMGLADKAVLVSRVGLPGQRIDRDLSACPDTPSYFSLILVNK